ncbi:MAG: triose-phosphate isomerase family protein [Candidatus Paceibacterota bacterium]
MTKKEKQKFLVVANWKMNPVSGKLAKQIFSSVKKVSNKLRNIDTVICPPYIFMENMKTSGHRFVLGAQDLFAEPEGSFTGNISYIQLKNLGVKYSLIGHSEKRKEGETNQSINEKVKASLKGMIVPIICIGEDKRDEAGEYLKFIKDQLVSSLVGLSKNSIKDIVIAYEPIWAIGKDAKREPTTSEIFEMNIFIKKVLSDIYDTKSVPPTKILYGGSVNEKNIESILKDGGVDGVLVGRASLDPKKFIEILKKAENLNK